MYVFAVVKRLQRWFIGEEPIKRVFLREKLGLLPFSVYNDEISKGKMESGGRNDGKKGAFAD